MNILIDIGHPANVHYFKHFAWEMEKRGHRIFFTTLEKEFEPYLLQACGFPYKKLGNHKKSLAGKIMGLISYNIRLFLYCLKIRPDMLMAAGSISAAHVAFLLRKPFIQLEDTGNMEQIRLYLPFTSVVLTPDVLRVNLGKKQISYAGYQEICYLHPKYFTPDPGIYRYLGIKQNEAFAILRFVSWDATHDVGQKGLSMDLKRKIVSLLSSKMQVFISSEGTLPEEFEKFRVKIPPEKMHDALAFAQIYIGEGATMASEAGLVGTPSFYINSIRACNNEDQESFGTVYNFKTGEGILEKIENIVNTPDLKNLWAERSRKVFAAKSDVTAMMVWFVENYPQSRETIHSMKF